MRHKIFSIFSLLILPAVLLIAPLVVQANPTNLDEVAHMKAGHHKVEGVVSEVKSCLYTVKTSTAPR